MGAITHQGEVLQRLPANASQINFNNTGTNLNSTQTENAIKEVNTKANTLQSEKADTDMVASDFSTAVSYTAGNYCIYEGKFYKFKNNHSGAWSAADVDEIKIAGELSSVKSGLTNYVKVDYAHLNESVTLQAGFIDLLFTAPTIEGYKPISVVAYNLADRALGSSVYISGFDMRNNVAHIYGSVSQEVTITTAAYVSIIYIRN